MEGVSPERVRSPKAMPPATAATATASSAIFCERPKPGLVLLDRVARSLAVGAAHLHAGPDGARVLERQRERKHIAFLERMLQAHQHHVPAARLERDRRGADFDGAQAFHLHHAVRHRAHVELGARGDRSRYAQQAVALAGVADGEVGDTDVDARRRRARPGVDDLNGLGPRCGRNGETEGQGKGDQEDSRAHRARFLHAKVSESIAGMLVVVHTGAVASGTEGVRGMSYTTDVARVPEPGGQVNINKESQAKAGAQSGDAVSALERLPHITKRVCLLWQHPEFDAFTSHLMMDSRDRKSTRLNYSHLGI